jgi:hypothetical protein
MPGFERPVPNDTVTTAPTRPKPTVAAPLASDQPVPTPIAKAHRAIENALTTFEDAWADIANAEGRGQLTMDGRAAWVADVDQSGAVDEAVAQAAARAEKADADYKAARAGLSPESKSVLDALRHSQHWSRVSRELDSLPAERLVGMAQRLIVDATPAELAALAQELPSYLRSRGGDDSWVDQALEAADPRLCRAAETRRRAHQSAEIVSANGRSAKRALQSAASGSYRRPQLVPVDKYDPDSSGVEALDADRGPTTRGDGPASG